MSIDLTEAGIDKLVSGRIVCDNFKGLIANNPALKSTYNQNLNFELVKLGFEGYISFMFMNAAYNVYEFDNCYRVRHKDLPLTIEPPQMEASHFCIAGSGCKKRGYPPCAHELNVNFVRCYNNDNIISKFMDFKDSKMCQEHYIVAEKLGLDITKLFVPHPIGAIACSQINPETMTPIFCEGVCVKIREPLFNLFWGMEKYFDLGEMQQNLRISMNGGRE